MYNLDKHIKSWLVDFNKYMSSVKPQTSQHELIAMKILFEAAIEMYLSIHNSNATLSVRAILTRTLIECYADTYAIFRHTNPSRQAKKYTKYAIKMNKLFSAQAAEYVQLRDTGTEGKIRPFEITNNYLALWNGKNITDRVKFIDQDSGSHIIAYYEFFSLFTHMNPVRQLYIDTLNEDKVLSKYPGYIMLMILRSMVINNGIPNKYFESLNEIASDYANDYMKYDTSPEIKNAR